MIKIFSELDEYFKNKETNKRLKYMIKFKNKAPR